MTQLIGLPADEAEKLLKSQGFTVKRVVYEPKRRLEDADSERVVRVRPADGGCFEITVSRFKTMVQP